MMMQRFKRIAACFLAACFSWSLACTGEESANAYAVWHWKESFQNMQIDAEVSGYPTDAQVSILRCAKKAWTPEQEAQMIHAIFPRLATAFHQENIDLVLEKDGKALGASFDRETFYCTAGLENFADNARIVFSDSCVSAATEQTAPYETVTYASTAAQGYEWLEYQFGDLLFAAQEEIIDRSNRLLQDLDIPNEARPFFIMAYSDHPETASGGLALAYRQYQLNGEDLMAPYKNSVSANGGECYQLNYSILYKGIPTSLYTKYLAMEDTFNDPPTVQLWWNRNGMIYMRLWNFLQVKSVAQTAPLISLSDAAKTADDYAGNILTLNPVTCIRIRLEYYTVNYKGGIDGKDYELVPMWTFYFSDGFEPITVNAITGELIW